MTSMRDVFVLISGVPFKNNVFWDLDADDVRTNNEYLNMNSPTYEF